MADSNPFGDPYAATGAPPAPAAAANPFEVPSPAPAGTYANGMQQPHTGMGQQPAPSPADNPFGVSNAMSQPPAAMSSPAQQYGTPYAASPQVTASPGASVQTYSSSYSAPGQPASSSGYSPSGYGMQTNPTGGAPAGMPSYDSALVPSQQPSNPYAGVVAPAQDPFSAGMQQQQHQLVPAAQQSNQWAVSAPTPTSGAAGGASFDPFAPPPPAPAPAPVPEPPQQTDAFGYGRPPAGSQDLQPYAAPAPVQTQQVADLGPFGDSSSQQQQPPPPQPERPSYSGPDQPVQENRAIETVGNYQAYEYGQKEDPAQRPDEMDDVNNRPVRNPYREELARQAPPGASPLPKAELVRKKGYVLSRISFRTIVMKKWKQSYWVQYGPHTMLWFRSEADFSDWLNNPYHDQAQRNFLIKLAVNFVHDLYKPNVRGYQVTQCRTKAYGNKMVRQFKLERWMDYGPTIAAAFGSYNPKEVDALREALVECMRNTPKNSGIRATGAVRQSQEEMERARAEEAQRAREYDHEQEGYDREGEANRSGEMNGGEAGASGESVAEEADLLDVENWDDVPSMTSSQHQQMTQSAFPGAAPPGHAPSPYAVAPGAYPPAQQQYATQQPPQQGNPYHQGAMVPVAGQQAYPGAPPVPPSAPNQQPYAGMPQQDPWGGQAAQQPPTPQGQPSPYGAPAYGAPPAYGSPQQPYQPQTSGY